MLQRIHTEDVASNNTAEDRFTSNLEGTQNKTFENLKKTPKKALITAEAQQNNVSGAAFEHDAVRKKFLDQQVKKIMAKKEARMQSEPVKKSRKVTN